MAEEETGEEEFECEDGLVPQERDECHLNIYDTTLKQIRLLGEIILFVWSIVYLAIAGKEWSFLGTKIFLHTMSLSQSRIFFLIACILLILMVPLRLSCQLVLEDAVSVFVMLFTGSHFLFFCF